MPDRNKRNSGRNSIVSTKNKNAVKSSSETRKKVKKKKEMPTESKKVQDIDKVRRNRQYQRTNYFKDTNSPYNIEKVHTDRRIEEKSRVGRANTYSKTNKSSSPAKLNDMNMPVRINKTNSLNKINTMPKKRQNTNDRNYSKDTSDYLKSTEIKRKRRKKTAKHNNLYSAKFVTFGVFSLILIYLFGYFFTFMTQKKISYDIVQYGSVETPETIDGVIIRDEKVYTAPVSGIVDYNVSENDKVKKGEIICSIKDEEIVESLEADLEEIEKKILSLQENREDMSWFAEDVKRVNKQIKETIDKNAISFVRFDIKNLYDLKSNIQKKLDVRNQMLLSENKGSLQELAQKKDTQESELSKNIINLNAQDGGIVSYYIDGFENSLTVDNIDKLTKEQLKIKTSDFEEMKSIVQAKDNVFKIIRSNQWYIACYISPEFIEGWETGDTRTIYIKDKEIATPLEVKVRTILPYEKESYIVLEISKDIVDYADKRSVTFELDKAQVGYKIPNNAIVEKSLLKIPSEYIQNDVVIKETNKGISYISITNSGENKEENVVYTQASQDGLNIGDVIQKPGDETSKYTINDSITTKGVYVMNTGIAEFYKINTDNSTNNTTYTILDPALNTNINIYDRIVTDTKNIEEQQKLYK